MSIKQYNHDRYSLYNGDCVEVMRAMPDSSVDFSIFSPPFVNLYIYSDDLRDMGNCKSPDEFFTQMSYMTKELYRILRPGRLIAVHCKNTVKYKNRDGVSGWYDFRGDLIRHFESFGFQYHSEVTIWTDPVREMQKTKTQRLLYCQLRRDASKTGIGMPEYLVIFRKWSDDESQEVPIKHYDNITNAEKDGATELSVFDLPTWQRYASPVWFDINRTDVLTGKMARDEKDEKHICPLQLEVIERAVRLWTNPNDIVFTPFMGIGSECYQSLKMGRRAVGIELKDSYYAQAVNNCIIASKFTDKKSLF